jgi:antitoxin (DNA-binding transcriptional repressor) of toxin-antitoxin stability system
MEDVMTLTFDVNELSTRLAEMLAEIEAGHDVLLAQDAQPVAKLAKLPTVAPNTVDDAIASLRENRKNFAPITIDEIIEWKNEGRR